MSIDKQRVAAVKKLEEIGYVWREGKWLLDLGASQFAPVPTIAPGAPIQNALPPQSPYPPPQHSTTPISDAIVHIQHALANEVIDLSRIGVPRKDATRLLASLSREIPYLVAANFSYRPGKIAELYGVEIYEV